MSNLVYPALPGLAFNVGRSPSWKNTIREADSGKRYALAHWSTPRWTYKLTYEFLRSGSQQELQSLVGFFLQHQGDYDTWLFEDPDDNTATRQQIGTANGLQVSWQLLRNLGGYLEPVKELNGAPQVYVNGTLATVTADLRTGLVTFASAPSAGAVIDWSGNYYIRCRFTKPAMDLEKFMAQLWKGSVEFSSEK